MGDSVIHKLARFIRSRDVAELAGVSEDEMAACLELVDAAASQQNAALWRCRRDIFSLVEGLEIEPRDGASQEELTRDPLMRTLELYLRAFDVAVFEGRSPSEIEQCEGLLGAAYELRDGLRVARADLSVYLDGLTGVRRPRKNGARPSSAHAAAARGRAEGRAAARAFEATRRERQDAAAARVEAAGAAGRRASRRFLDRERPVDSEASVSPSVSQ